MQRWSAKERMLNGICQAKKQDSHSLEEKSADVDVKADLQGKKASMRNHEGIGKI